MARSTLPVELLTSVFSYLSQSDLATASCVCQTWKKLAFSPLYQTVYLCLATHLEQFVERVRTEDGESQFSINHSLKGLVFDIEHFKGSQEEEIDESHLDTLNTVVPLLKNLKYLSWGLHFIPEDMDLFRSFQTECPNLDSVHIWIRDDSILESDRYEMLLEFRNLTHFSLSIWDIPPLFDEDHFDPIASLLTRCPQLSSIILDFNHDEFPYSPTVLVSTLGDQCNFPHLQRFRAQGLADPDWFEFFDNPGLHPFRQFLSRHPRIEDLGLGWARETAYNHEIPPSGIAELFPLLRQFEGPLFIFKPLVLSALAEQIEKLVIVDNQLCDDVSLTEIYDQVPRLPKLRKFGIWAEDIEVEVEGVEGKGILVNLLRTIVSAADQLEEIEIHAEINSDDYGELMSLIAQVRGLRSVTLNESILGFATGECEELEWKGFATKLRLTCPKLRTIYRPMRKFDKENREKVWDLHCSV